MPDLISLHQVKDYNDLFGIPTTHPLINVVDFKDFPPFRHRRILYGIYAIFLKDLNCGEMLYGRQTYDYQEGTIVSIAPGQVAGVEDDGQLHTARGRALVFHPDLIHGTHLASAMKDYSFFSYDSNEALHLSESERAIVTNCLDTIKTEADGEIDRHTRRIIVAHIETLLDYCLRFYERQFNTRRTANHDVLTRFEDLLDGYYKKGMARREGLPTVKYFADNLCLSSNYFGDLVKRETGRTAREHIQLKLVDIAKERVLDPSQNISSVAYELGFQYPQHFTRLFKKVTGYTPQEYRSHA